MLCAPAAKVVMEIEAAPTPFRDDVPSVVVPSSNFTEPVGTVEPPELTEAVSVMDWSNVDGFADEANAVLVLPCWTTWLNIDEVLPLKLPSPE
jgi:hypothetical protein